MESCGTPGHGLSLGAGFALRARLAGTASRVFVVLGEDECGQGSTWEAAAGAGKYGLSNLVAVIEQMGQHHPPEPHWYLPLIGVDPARQGQGLGAALMRPVLAKCDAAGLPAYLESTSPPEPAAL